MGSSTRCTTFFALGHLFLWFLLLCHFLFVISGFLSRHRWSFRVVRFRPVKFLFWNLLMSQLLFLFSFVDFFLKVIRLSTILACPYYMLLGPYMLVVLAQLRWYILFFRCRIMHVRSQSPKSWSCSDELGVLGGLGTLSQSFIMTFGTFIFSGC